MADISQIKLPNGTTYDIKDANAIHNSIGTAAGDIVYWSAASTPTRLAAGTSGQTLTINDNGIPEWTTGGNDTKVTQTVTTGTDIYMLLAKNTTSVTTDTDTSRFVDGIALHPDNKDLGLTIDTTASSGTVDGDLYSAIDALGWWSDINIY